MAKKSMERRKDPRQQRARLTVDSILQAMEQLVVDQGYATVSTNRIAERAGISIGTLYHYFPNKEAVALALYEHTSSLAALEMRKILVETIDSPIEETIPFTVRKILEIHSEHSAVLLGLVDEVADLREIAYTLSFDTLVRGNLRTFLDQHSLELDVGDRDLTTFCLQNTIMGNIRHFVLEAPEHIDTDEFVEELSRVVIGYMKHRQDVAIHPIVQDPSRPRP